MRHLTEAERDREVHRRRFYEQVESGAVHAEDHHTYDVYSDKPYDFDLRPRRDPDEEELATLKFRKVDGSNFHPRSVLKESYYYFNKENPHEVIPMHMRDGSYHHAEEQYEDSL